MPFFGEEEDDDERSMSSGEELQATADYPWNRSRAGSAASASVAGGGTKARPGTPRDEPGGGAAAAGRKMYGEAAVSADRSARAALDELRERHEAREKELGAMVQEGLFHDIESFLAVELEQQGVEMAKETESSLLPDGDGGGGLDDEISWYRKAIVRYEDFIKRVRVLRSAFIRTFLYFRRATESGVDRVRDRHAREVLAAKASHSMRCAVGVVGGAAARAGSSYERNPIAHHLELAQMRERHALEISNMRDMNDRVSSRELQLLEFHLRCTEEVMQADMAMWRALAVLRRFHRDQLRRLQEKEDERLEQEALAEAKGHRARLQELRMKLDTGERHEAVAARREESAARRAQFMRSGSVAADALYKLTFSSERVEYASDSVLNSDDSADEGGDGESCVTPVPASVLLLQRAHRRQAHASRKARRKESEARVAEQRRYLRLERRAQMDSMRRGVERVYADQVRGHRELSEAWAAQKRQLDASHSAALAGLLQKHRVDTHVLLEADKQLNASTRAESQLEAQGAMSSHVFHEVRNVLAALSCVCDSLIGAAPDEVTQLANRQRIICSYAQETMSNMMDVVKYQSGMYVPRLLPVKLSKLAEHVAVLQGDRVRPGVALRLVADDTLVLLDSHLVTQLLVNLLSNSSKFTESGEITVVCTTVPDDDEENGESAARTHVTVELGVVDTGVGMDPAKFTSETREFSEAYDTNAYMMRCSGYGLYLTRLIARTLRSRLAHASPVSPGERHRASEEGGPGSSTTLRLLCPLAGTEAPQLSIPPAAASATWDGTTSGRTTTTTTTTTTTATTTADDAPWRFDPEGDLSVLVTEDQRLVRISLLHMLSKLVDRFPRLSMSISTAASAEEATRVCQTEGGGGRFDLVFMDLHFDQTAFTPPPPSPRPGSAPWRSRAALRLESGADMQQAVRIFARDERLFGEEGDGSMTGDAFARDYEGEGALVIATGSPADDLKEYVVLTKPFEVQGLVDSMEEALARGAQLRRKLRTTPAGDALTLPCGAVLFKRKT